MNAPSSTIKAAGISSFIVATLLLILKAKAPEFYVLIPPDYHLHLVFATGTVIGYFWPESVINKK